MDSKTISWTHLNRAADTVAPNGSNIIDQNLHGCAAAHMSPTDVRNNLRGKLVFDVTQTGREAKYLSSTVDFKQHVLSANQ